MISYANNFISSLVLSISEIIKHLFNKSQEKIFYFNIFIEVLRKIVWDCLPIVTLTVGASAVIYSIHMAPEASRRGLSAYIGGVLALSLIRETVPVMGTLALITQYGTGMTAQIASMKVSDQIDAIKIFKVIPELYLLLPMILAGIIGFPILIFIGIFFGLFVGFFSTDLLIDTNFIIFKTSMLNALAPKDLYLALIKSLFFGLCVSLISYVAGVLTRGGAKAVGDSTRLSVVINFIVVIVLDYIITALWL